MSGEYINPSREELMITAGAHALRDGELVLVGVGLPQIAVMLAKMTHAPNLKIIVEIGVANPSPVDTPLGVADPRIWLGTNFMGGTLDILGMTLQRGLVDVGFLGGSQIDPYGNLNTTLVFDEGKPRRLVGSGGANDVASLAKRTIIIMRHEKRRFVPEVTYLTSPGHLSSKTPRKSVGLTGTGPELVITDLCVFTFDDQTKRMKLKSIHPGVTLTDVISNTGFEVITDDEPPRTPLPNRNELRLLRDVVDPQHVYVGRQLTKNR